jgi:hypothetical protein
MLELLIYYCKIVVAVICLRVVIVLCCGCFIDCICYFIVMFVILMTFCLKFKIIFPVFNDLS